MRVRVEPEPSSVASALRQQLRRNWWLFGVRGGLVLLLAVYCLTKLDAGFGALTQTLAVAAIADGLLSLAVALWRAAPGGRHWLLAMDAIAGMVAGALVLATPGLSVAGFVMIAGLRVGLAGVVWLMSAARLAGDGAQAWVLAGSGVSILLAVGLLVAPPRRIDEIMILLCAYLLAFSVVLVALALRLRR